MEELRRRLEAYYESGHRARHRGARLGVDPGPELEEIDARFDDLCSGDPLDGLRSQAGGLSGERDARRRLIAAVESAVVSARTRRLERALRQRGDSAGWTLRMAAESDCDRRRQLWSEHDSAGAEHDELREELWLQRDAARAGLGYGKARERAQACHPDVVFEAWRERAQRLLEGSDRAYRDHLRAALRRAGVREEAAHTGDIPWVHGAPEVDARFPAGKLTDLLEYTTETMGLSVAAAPGLSLETGGEARGPSVQCFPIREPGEIALLCHAPSGVNGVRALFAGATRAFQHAYSSSALPVERRRVIDPALALGFGLLFEACIGDPVWIAEGPAALRAEELEHGVRLRDLLRLRRWAVEIEAEMELSIRDEEGAPHRLARRQAEALTDATGYAHTTAGCLDHLDAELASVHRLRAACFAAQLRGHLRHVFGRRFWRARGAGDLLKEVWNTGSTYTADELASQLGFAPLDVAVVLEEIPG